MAIRSIAGLLAASAVAACGASAKEIRAAQTSAYDADFAIVYSQALAAVQTLYPYLDDNASAGIIRTAWHSVAVRDNTSDGSEVDDRPNAATDPNAAGNRFESTAGQRKRYFVRFRVYVLGGRPWRVRIEAEAQEHEPGLNPAPLSGAATPAWLPGRAEALQLAIHRRLANYAVPIKTTTVRRADTPPAKPKPERSYGEIPAAASQRIGQVRSAVLAGDFAALRGYLVDDFVWSLGGQPSADQALAMWQADPTLNSHLVSALERGCRASASGDTITCPLEYTPGQPFRGYRATFVRAAGEWRMSEFVAEE